MVKIESIQVAAFLDDGTKAPVAAIIQSLLDRVDALETALDAAQRANELQSEDLEPDWSKSLREEAEDACSMVASVRQEIEECVGECEARDIAEEVVAQHVDHLVCEDGVHDLVASYIIDDDSGVLRRKVIEIVADALQGR
tara:strand:+ start:175 stop:597 length:423 start_codon:yes stop_codon:yes gene_type:complete